jgi:hypothetical protein
MSKVTVVLIGAGLLLVSAAAAAETYRWVDAEGKVHYSDRPTQGAQEVQVRVPGEEPALPPIADNGSLAPDPDAPAQGSDEAAQVRAQLCDQARERLARYEKADGIYEEGADGQRRQLTVEERVDTILKARQSVQSLCEEQPTAEAAP